ncbi:MAG: DUF484 family protein [Gammaproteobacteria bacterium]
MSTQHERNFIETPITEQSVAEYLREHPDFFQQHQSLLASLQVPHSCGSAVSLVEYQLSILRQQNGQMKRKLKELVHLGRENDRLSERMLHLTVALIEATDLEQVLNAVEDTLRHDFKADALALRLFDPDGQLDALRPELVLRPGDPELAEFDQLFKSNRPLCGRLRGAQTRFLFGDRAEEIGSAALIPVGRRGEFGLLGIGSDDPERFHPGMGTLFLGRLSVLIGAALQRQLGAREDG